MGPQEDVQWPCPYCSSIFSSRKEIQKHLVADEQRILNLLVQLVKALRTPGCQYPQPASELPVRQTNNDDPQSTPKPDTPEQHRCPHADCTLRSAFSKRQHMIRHYRTHVPCDVCCGCGSDFKRVGDFEKHISNCVAMQEVGNPGHMQTLGLRKHLSKLALDALTKHEQNRLESHPASTTNEQSQHGLKKRKRRRSQARGAKFSEDAPSSPSISQSLHACDPSTFNESTEIPAGQASAVNPPLSPSNISPPKEPRTNDLLAQEFAASSECTVDASSKLPVPFSGALNVSSSLRRDSHDGPASCLIEMAPRPQPAIDWSILDTSSYIQSVNEAPNFETGFDAFVGDLTTCGLELHNLSDDGLKVWMDLNSTFDFDENFTQI